MHLMSGFEVWGKKIKKKITRKKEKSTIVLNTVNEKQEKRYWPVFRVLEAGCRTEPEPAKFYFSEPEPNLNPQNSAQVNQNRT